MDTHTTSSQHVPVHLEGLHSTAQTLQQAFLRYVFVGEFLIVLEERTLARGLSETNFSGLVLPADCDLLYELDVEPKDAAREGVP